MGELLYFIKAGSGCRGTGTEGDGFSSRPAGVPGQGRGPQERRPFPEQRGSQEGSAHRLRDEGGASAGSPART